MKHARHYLEKMEQSRKALQDLVIQNQREFKTRAIEISAEQMTVNISGREAPVEGHFLYSENSKNPNPVEITVTDGLVYRSREDPKILVIPSGVIEISAKKEIPEQMGLYRRKGEIPIVPVVRDPDLTEIDGKTFRQTGTLQVRVTSAAMVLLDELPG